jgi:hypothetical protein
MQIIIVLSQADKNSVAQTIIYSSEISYAHFALGSIRFRVKRLNVHDPVSNLRQ